MCLRKHVESGTFLPGSLSQRQEPIVSIENLDEDPELPFHVCAFAVECSTTNKLFSLIQVFDPLEGFDGLSLGENDSLWEVAHRKEVAVASPYVRIHPFTLISYI